MLLFNAHAPSVREFGTVIENGNYNSEVNRILIRLDEMKQVPNQGDFYLVSSRGLGNKYHRLEVEKLPDENDLLSFLVPKKEFNTKQLAAIKVGARLKIKGPFNDSNEEVS
jgi:hypothetical protein